VKAVWNNKTVAESDDIIEVEGYFYFPESAVNKKFLKESDMHTTCPWKGVASYYDVVVDGKVAQNSAFYYPHPKTDMAKEKVTKRIAFWQEVDLED